MWIIMMRDGVEYKISDDCYKKILDIIKVARFIRFDDALLNTADITRIIKQADYQNTKRQQAGLISTSQGWLTKNEFKSNSFLKLDVALELRGATNPKQLGNKQI